MAGDELIERIDRILETRDREQREWQDTQAREQREWLDALTERHVGITQAMIESITKLQAEIADQRAQIQANTDAVLKVLDRLGPSPQSG